MNLFKKAKKDKKEISILQQVYRFIAVACAQVLKHTPLTPNQLSVLSFLVGISAAFAFGYTHFVLGLVLAQLACLLDFMDGALARAKNASSNFGQWLELVLGDRIADVFIIFGIAIGLQSSLPRTTLLIIAFLFATGRLFLNSINDYTSYYPMFAPLKQEMSDGLVYKNRSWFGFLARQLIYTRVNHYLLMTIAVLFGLIIPFLIVITLYVWLFFILLSVMFTFRVAKLK